jgi:arylsulfatase A-like enzyme
MTGAEPTPAGRRVRWWRLPALLATGLALASAAGCARPEGPRVLLIGLDGATWKVIGPMLQRGELPAFRRLVAEGAYAERFETISTTSSPVVWTSIATGRSPEDHGVVDYVSSLPNGTRIPVTSSVRRVPALWEVASDHGISVGVIGWWASWPAEPVNGYVVTDHANPGFSEFLFEDEKYWTADPDRLAALKRDFYPLDIAPILSHHWMRKDEFPYEEFQDLTGLTDQQIYILRLAPWSKRNVYSWAKTFYRIDQPLFRIAKDLAGERPTDLLMVYYRIADAVQHYGWDLVQPGKYATPPGNLARDRNLIPGVYRLLDEFVDELLDVASDDTWVIVASDHGAEPSAMARDPLRRGRPGGHSTAAKGVLFIHGPGVRPGHRIDGADPYDLLPTMAWLLDLPLSRELEGHILATAFEDSFVAAHPVHTVATYGARATAAARPSPADAAMLESLRGLGYIE